MDDALIEALRLAVEGAPDNVPLRLHLAELLVTGGRSTEAVVEAAGVLQRDPDNLAARELMSRR